MTVAPGGWLGGLLMLIAIFLPAFLLVVGPLPFWEPLRQRASVQRAMAGVNAAVVGMRAAAVALGAFGLLVFGRISPVWVVCLSAFAGWLMTAS